MKFNRTALRHAVQAALDAHESAHEQRAEEWKSFVVEDRDSWLAGYSDEWLDACKTIRSALGQGQPVTRGMLPKDDARSGSVATYSEPNWDGRQRRDPGNYVPHRELLSLRATLDAVTDDEITPSGLRNLGITSSTMQTVIRHLAIAGPGAA